MDRFIVVPAATRGGGIPATGWARVAMALHALHGTTDAVVLIDVADGELVVVDWGRKDYWWVGRSGPFPIDPAVTRVRLFRGDGARLPFLKEQPADLSSLLWAVGRYAFPTSTAWWLRDDARYRLVRWPDFASVDHEPEHVSMTAKLSAGVGSSRVDLQACKLEYSIVSPK